MPPGIHHPGILQVTAQGREIRIRHGTQATTFRHDLQHRSSSLIIILRRAQCPVPARLSTRISENLHGRARQAPCKQRPAISTSHEGVTFRGALPAGALRFQEPHISVLPGGGFAGMEAAPHVSAGSPIFDRLTGKSFWKDGVRGGRTFFQKGFPPRRVFPHFKSSSAACGLALPARFPLRNGYPLLRRPFGVPPGRAPHQARPPAGSGETSGAGGALAVVPQPVPLLQQKNPRWTGDNQNHPQSGWFALAL